MGLERPHTGADCEPVLRDSRSAAEGLDVGKKEDVETDLERQRCEEVCKRTAGKVSRCRALARGQLLRASPTRPGASAMLIPSSRKALAMPSSSSRPRVTLSTLRPNVRPRSSESLAVGGGSAPLSARLLPLLIGLAQEGIRHPASLVTKRLSPPLAWLCCRLIGVGESHP